MSNQGILEKGVVTTTVDFNVTLGNAAANAWAPIWGASGTAVVMAGSIFVLTDPTTVGSGKGYVVGGEARAGLGLVTSMADLDDKLAALDLDQPYPGEAAEGQRGRAGSPKRPILPYGWLDSRELSEDFRRDLHEAELSVSGG